MRSRMIVWGRHDAPRAWMTTLPDTRDPALALLPTAPAPHSRILGYDVARALAIAGMVLVHFCLVMSTSRGAPSGVARFIDGLDGRPAAIFVILAGIGLSLRAGSARAVDLSSE